MWKLACHTQEAEVPDFERVVGFKDAQGVDHEIQLDAGNIEVVKGSQALLNVAPVSRRGDRFLIELPAETLSGQRRVWVERSQLSETEHDLVRS